MTIYILIPVIIIFAALFVFFSIENTKSGGFSNSDLNPKYKRKLSVMSRSESAFFFELQKQLPNDYYIFPKMRIADVLDIPNGHDYYRMRNKALPKHVDFLVCDKFFKPIVALELNGSSHDKFKQQETDRIKNEMFKDSGLPLETINVGNSFNESISRLQHYFA